MSDLTLLPEDPDPRVEVECSCGASYYGSEDGLRAWSRQHNCATMTWAIVTLMVTLVLVGAALTIYFTWPPG
jgi:hypothetical protein